MSEEPKVTPKRIARYLTEARSGLEDQVEGLGGLVSERQNAGLGRPVPTVSVERARERLRGSLVEQSAQIGPVFSSEHLDDSLDLVDITMSVEDEFDISIPDAVAENIDSIDATVAHILKGKAS